MKKIGLISTSIVLIYAWAVVFTQNSVGWLVSVALGAITVTWILPYLPALRLLEGKTQLMFGLVYHVMRLMVILASMYVLFSHKIFTIYQLVIGYFILLLISLLSIKNERNFRS